MKNVIPFPLIIVISIGLIIGCSRKPPTITNVEPYKAPSSGGTEIIITGTGFKANPPPVVFVGGFLASDVKVVSKTKLKAIIPPGDPGPVCIAVRNANAKVASMWYFGFGYYDAASSINSDPMTAIPEDVDAPPGSDVSFNQDIKTTSIIGSDGVKMKLVPAGEVRIGNKTVYVDSFYIDEYEVTNARYKKFKELADPLREEPIGYDFSTDRVLMPWRNESYNGKDHPVVCVSWDDAKAYCDWVGERLPTEAEFMRAAKGGNTKYPWGDTWPPPPGSGNLLDETCATYASVFPERVQDWYYVQKSYIKGYNDGYLCTAPVGSFIANGYGLYDMIGNVQEFCDDWYDSRHTQRVTCGSHFSSAEGYGSSFLLPHRLKYPSLELSPMLRLGGAAVSFVGFRCAQDALK